ncbi:MAG: hypothetical protein MZV64_01725 [Ignavibacteriales bacterium]|nr:hypothetical protein [Ignavibacteriales bacterium]
MQGNPQDALQARWRWSCPARSSSVLRRIRSREGALQWVQITEKQADARGMAACMREGKVRQSRGRDYPLQPLMPSDANPGLVYIAFGPQAGMLLQPIFWLLVPWGIIYLCRLCQPGRHYGSA